MITFTPAPPRPLACPSASPVAADPMAALVGAALAQRAQREQLLADPERLHPALWRAQGSGLRSRAGVATGFAALDAELPEAGWPTRVLTELLLPRPGIGEIRLLAPALGAIARAGRCLMLFDPPAEACAPALVQLGIPVQQCIVVRGLASGGAAARRPRSAVRPVGADLCWALEQALRSGQVGAVLAWPGAAVMPETLRRLQLAAQAHEGPAFVLREIEAAGHPSPAPLRLSLQPGGPDELSLSVVKRRGPASAQALRLALAPVLSERARSRAGEAGLVSDVPRAAAVSKAAAAPPPGGWAGG